MWFIIKKLTSGSYFRKGPLLLEKAQLIADGIEHTVLLVLLVKRNTLILFSHFHPTFLLLLLVSVTANYQNLESQILGLSVLSTRNRRTLSTERTISVVHRFTSVM